jgi:predicted acylesterase/phospholipase RssA
MTQRRRKRRPRIGLALAGGGPFGAIYEIGALAALEDSIEGLSLTRLDCYVGVSAGAFLAAALANGIPVHDVYRLFIAGGKGEGAIAPRLFKRPAWREYLRAAIERRVPTGLFDNEAIHRYLEQGVHAPRPDQRFPAPATSALSRGHGSRHRPERELRPSGP